MKFKIEIKKKNYKQLIECIYLGNLIINGYRKDDEIKREYSDFVNGVLMQIVKSNPEPQTVYEFRALSYEKSDETLLSDLTDRIDFSVRGYCEEYAHALFCEMLADIIADKNYPVISGSETDALVNLIAKNLYCDILTSGNERFVSIDAPKICDKIKRAARL